MDIEKAIRAECDKLISRHGAKLALIASNRKRFWKSTGVDPKISKVKNPIQWSAGKEFNPFYVRKKSGRIARAISASLEKGEYQPRQSLIVQLDKPDGGKRPISIFPVADAAVAGLYYKKILSRNQTRFSPFSYAYRTDMGIHDAIERLYRMFRGFGRCYSVEFDFSKYFDTIEHAYVLETLAKYFKVTRKETQIAKAFLQCQRAFGIDNFRKQKFVRCLRGVPQGNSLSLLLANVACHELDLQLENQGHSFARYADDIVILSKTDSNAGEALELILEHCARTGLSINFKKSDGITELTPQALRSGSPTPLKKVGFDYLGHNFSFRLVNQRNNPAPRLVRRLGIRERSVSRIKDKVSNIIYSHLQAYLERDPNAVSRKRIDSKNKVDWDVVTCINDLRSYLYGGISESEVQKALSDRSVRIYKMVATMGFFPLTDDVSQLKALDGWLLNALSSAISKRETILRNPPFSHRFYPTLAKEDLLEAVWYETARKESGYYNEVTVPSFVRAWKYARKGLKSFNLKDLPHISTLLY